MKSDKNIKEKILYWDLETSPNLGFFWQTGNRLSIGPDAIVKERAIICVAYKWKGAKKIECIQWNKGSDKELCIKFAKVIEQADWIVAHNGNAFDLKWFMGRCIYHGINTNKFHFKKIDTLLLARRTFKFNSNKLDYLGKFLGFGGKKSTGGFQTWVDIVLHNKKSAMDKMIFYCKGDISLLEKIHNKINKYIPKKIVKK